MQSNLFLHNASQPAQIVRIRLYIQDVIDMGVIVSV